MTTFMLLYAKSLHFLFICVANLFTALVVAFFFFFFVYFSIRKWNFCLSAPRLLIVYAICSAIILSRLSFLLIKCMTNSISILNWVLSIEYWQWDLLPSFIYCLLFTLRIRNIVQQELRMRWEICFCFCFCFCFCISNLLLAFKPKTLNKL